MYITLTLTWFVNFVIIGYIMVPIISMNCLHLFFFLTHLFGVHSHQWHLFHVQFTLPPKFEHLPRMLANQMRAMPENYEYPWIMCICRTNLIFLLEPPDSLFTTKSSLPNYLHHTVLVFEKLLHNGPTRLMQQLQ